jgi:hypothetical protein
MKRRLEMETNMFTPIWLKILALILSGLAVFLLAARELVAEWLRGVPRLVLSKLQRATKLVSKEEVKLDERSLAKPV